MIDDDLSDVELALEVFAEYNLKSRIKTILDGEEAINILSKLNKNKQIPSLIILDLKMPKVDGLGVLAELKTFPYLKHVPVVVFTSSQEEKDIITAVNLGANAYIVKPVEFKNYYSVVKIMIEFWVLLNVNISEIEEEKDIH